MTRSYYHTVIVIKFWKYTTNVMLVRGVVTEVKGDALQRKSIITYRIEDMSFRTTSLFSSPFGESVVLLILQSSSIVASDSGLPMDDTK